jgi:ribonuclease E
MLDNEPTGAETGVTTPASTPTRARRRAASRPAGPPSVEAPPAAEVIAVVAEPPAPAPAKKAAAKRTRKAPAKKSDTAPEQLAAEPIATEPIAAEPIAAEEAPAKVAANAPAKRPAKRAAKKAAEAPVEALIAAEAPTEAPATEEAPVQAAVAAEPPAEEKAPAPGKRASRGRKVAAAVEAAAPEALEVAAPLAPTFAPPVVLFQAPAAEEAPTRRRTRAKATEEAVEPTPVEAEESEHEAASEPTGEQEEGAHEEGAGEARRRRRRRGGRGRGRRGEGTGDEDEASEEAAEHEEAAGEPSSAEKPEHAEDGAEEGDGGSRKRRRRRRRAGESVDESAEPNTVVRVRQPRPDVTHEVQGVKGSTRLEAKKQRRREGREQGRRRSVVLSESEFLARREAVERVMVVRKRGELTQIGVLEDGVLVEHYVSSAAAAGFAGNVYLGRVQNVLPSMEAAFVDIGKGRNAVLYAGEVNWDLTGLEGQPRLIESALKSGQSVLVQVTKDPIGHKGARLTSQVSLPGRFLVYVPDGAMTGISRKLPDTERSRLKAILKKVMPEGAGVIVRTAAEGASEEELASDVERLAAQWEDIQKKAKTANAPSLLHGEPDMTVRVIRDVFNEDFTKLVVQGSDEWNTVEDYVSHVAPDLAPRLEHWTSETDVFSHFRIDEQLAKALDRKVWLPSGGYLVIDRTEAMIVVDVNTGKFTGKGGNLEETVTKNNLEAAEEIVRQLRLRDLGGIIVIDFVDMVLESNRDLVMRRLLECLSRDRTKHQVAEVTSLGLVQMTRKRVGAGLLEAFSEPCERCNGRGAIVHLEPVAPGKAPKPVLATPPEDSQERKRRAEEAAKAASVLAKASRKSQEPEGDGAVEAEAEAVAEAADVSADGASEAPAPAEAPQAASPDGEAKPTKSTRSRRRKAPAKD